MKGHLQAFLDISVPDRYKQDPEAYLRASLGVLVSAAILMSSISYAIWTFSLGLYEFSLLNASLLFFCFISYSLFRRGMGLNTTAWIYYFGATIFIYLLGYFGGGQYSFGPILYPIAPIMGFGMTNRRVGLIQIIMSLVWIMFLVPFWESVFPPKVFPAEDEVYKLIYVSMVILMIVYIALIMMINEYNREQLIRKIRERDQTLLQQDKMASLGALTAGVAHEINNPLNFVSSNAHALKLDLEEIGMLLQEVHKLKAQRDKQQVGVILDKIKSLDTMFLHEEIKQLVASIERGAERTKSIVHDLKTFSRDTKDVFVLADIHEGLDSTLSILNNKIRDRIEVHKDYGDLPRIECQFGKLNQVFMNVLANAIQAIQGPGNIYIETREEKEEVLIRIRDTGVGIPAKVKQRIFEPFFTTKPMGEGTGLGLSISYGVIESHGGAINFSSQNGEGTTCSIRLPKKQNE